MSDEVFPGLTSQKLSVKTGAAAGDIPPLTAACEKQCRGNWCWAAVCTEIGRIFGGNEPQAQLADRVQRTVFTAAAPATAATVTPPCSADHFPGSLPLTALGHAIPEVQVPGGKLQFQADGVLTPDALLAELRAGRPVAAGIEWNQASSHVVLVVGASQGPKGWMFVVDDPIRDRTRLTYDALVHYQPEPGGPLTGTWNVSWHGISR